MVIFMGHDGLVLIVGSAPNIEGWAQLGELGLAFALSCLIGLERQFRQKSAGLRTHTLVGTGAALFMLISKYGFNDVLKANLVVVDPSRVAAQIVTGIGFLGAGIIFVRRDSVHGLTTAAGIWLTAAVGAAAGAGLPLLASVSTGIYLVISVVLRPVSRKLPGFGAHTSLLRVRYPDGRGMLRQLLAIAGQKGFTINQVSTRPLAFEPSPFASVAGALAQSREEARRNFPMVEVTMSVQGRRDAMELASSFSELEGVEAVVSDHIEEFPDE